MRIGQLDINASTQNSGLNQGSNDELALERGKRVRMLRALSGLSRKQFQLQLNVSISTLNIWENGRVCLTAKGAARVIAAVATVGIKCSDAWLLYGTGQPPQIIKDAAVSSSSIGFQNRADPSNATSEIEHFIRNNKNAISCIVSDETMSPFFNIGDIVAGILFDIKELDSLVGQVVIVRTSTSAAIRKFSHISENTCYLQSCNESIANDNFSSVKIDDIVQIAKILLHRSF